MIEIVYSESVEDMLRASHLLKKDDFVCTVELMLDVGVLNEEWDSKYRRRLFREMFNYAFPVPDLNSEAPEYDMGTYFDESVESIKKMKALASSGETIRIWANPDPSGQCCTAFVCNLLLKTEGLGEVLVMYPPKFNFMDKSVYPCNSWSQFCKENAKAYMHLQRKMTSAELQFYSCEWERLKRENSVLRTVICNRVESVPEDFYDDMLLEYVPNEPTPEHMAMGVFLESKGYALDMLIPAWRLQKLIDCGRIEVVEDPDSETDFLSRKIRRVNQ